MLPMMMREDCSPHQVLGVALDHPGAHHQAHIQGVDLEAVPHQGHPTAIHRVLQKEITSYKLFQN
jgi:hypothetical protein